MAGIQQAVSSLATGLAYARKVREYGSMQKANLQAQQQRLALQKQKASIQKMKEKNKAKELEIKEYQAKTNRKLANAKIKDSKDSGEQITIGGKKVSLSSLGSSVAKQLKGGNK